MFEYVKANVSYVPDPIRMVNQVVVQDDLVAPPTETLRIRGGDCDDQAVLMASLLSAVGIENRMHLIESKTGGFHLLTEFAVDLALDQEISGTLDQFYSSIDRNTGPRTYWRFTEKDKIWLLADTTRNYIPDYDELVRSGFLVLNADNKINWYRLLKSF